MTKRDFLEKLSFSLNGRVNPAAVTEHVRFYEDYINTEIRKGKKESEVLDLLGDPRLIARTIAETEGSQTSGAGGGSYAGKERSYQEQGYHGIPYLNVLSRIPGWVWLILAVIALALVMRAVFSVFSVVLPVLLPILGVLLLVKLFRDWMQ